MILRVDHEHLFYQIGSDGNDSVFTRTFSVLAIVQIVNRHRKEAFLSVEEFTDMRNKLIEYYTSEKDLRGYVQKSGWAHAAAHGADVMDELIQCSECNEDVFKEILKAFKKIMHDSGESDILNAIYNAEGKLNRFLKIDKELIG